MARKRSSDERPASRYDDFIYDDLQDANESTPAYRYPDSYYVDEKNVYRRRPVSDAKPDTETPDKNADETADGEGPVVLSEDAGTAASENADDFEDDTAGLGDLVRKKPKRHRAQETAAGILGALKNRLDDAADDADEQQKKYAEPGVHGRVRIILLMIITVIITVVLGLMVAYRITGASFTQAPENVIAKVFTPVQSAFSWVTDKLADYVSSIRRRSYLESAYNDLVAENERLTYEALRTEELEKQLSQFEDIQDELQLNSEMSPIVCTVIGKDDGNYFSTFTINHGKRDGIEDYMAVTINGALIGYTENVKETTGSVRTIIDSNASIAALIQSSREQGIVSGTLGMDGEPMCRMYYLANDSLPRPGDTVVTSGVGMSFPKGIPIGVVRESTRGMDENKQYIVIEPNVDFKHIEYVIVLRYQPQAEAVSGRGSVSSSIEFMELATARPYPTLRIGSLSLFDTPTPAPDQQATPTPEATATPTPSPTPAPTKTPLPTINGPVFEYQVLSTAPTEAPTATPTPSPTPYITLNPQDMTYEEDD